MARIRAANVAELIAVMTDGTQHFINRFHVAYGGVAPLSAAEANALAADFQNVYHSRIMPWMNVAFSSVQFEANDIDPVGFASGLSLGTFTGGTSTGNPMPLSLAGVISWRAQFPRYRGGKPRTYVSGMDSNNIANPRQLTTSARTSLEVAAQGMLSDLNALTFGTGPRSVSMISLATVRAKAPLAVPEQWPIVDATVDVRLGTQRRRLGKL